MDVTKHLKMKQKQKKMQIWSINDGQFSLIDSNETFLFENFDIRKWNFPFNSANTDLFLPWFSIW
jgi:hypothetical protein